MVNKSYKLKDGILNNLFESTLDDIIIFIGPKYEKMEGKFIAWETILIELLKKFEEINPGYEQIVTDQIRNANAWSKPRVIDSWILEIIQSLGSNVVTEVINMLYYDRKSYKCAGINEILKLPFRGIVTENISEVIDNAVREYNSNREESEILIYNASLEFIKKKKFTKERKWILKVNGSVEAIDSIINSFDSAYHNGYRKVIQYFLQNYKCVFVGYDSSDPDIKNVFNMLYEYYFKNKKQTHVLFSETSEAFDANLLDALSIKLVQCTDKELMKCIEDYNEAGTANLNEKCRRNIISFEEYIKNYKELPIREYIDRDPSEHKHYTTGSELEVLLGMLNNGNNENK